MEQAGVVARAFGDAEPQFQKTENNQSNEKGKL
jgi:hypothetical protein